MSLYGDYILEREGRETIESENGFVTFKIYGIECLIQDMYVKPEFRKSGVANKMANKLTEIARDRGCKFLSASVSPNTTDSTTSLKAILSYGFKLAKIDSQLIWFTKELK